MEVILKEDIQNLGKIGDIVDVKPGYGRNFLVPNGKAAFATKENLKILETQKVELERKQEKELNILREQASKFENLSLTIAAATDLPVLLAPPTRPLIKPAPRDNNILSNSLY